MVEPASRPVEKSLDSATGLYRVRIISGQYYACSANELVSTVLGSCVSAVFWDAEKGIGGINHFMHPGSCPSDRMRANTPGVAYYGQEAMSELLERMKSLGADCGNLTIKLFGGASLRSEKDDGIGAKNSEFAKKFLSQKGYTVAAADLGGPFPRKIVLNTETGKVMVKRLRSIQRQQIAAQEISVFDPSKR
ncbi:MAG: chemotaxis protein CheD [Burkholderiaceae bacterium]